MKRVLVETRINAIVNRLNKTKEEKHPDLAAEREERDKKIRETQRVLQLERVGYNHYRYMGYLFPELRILTDMSAIGGCRRKKRHE